MTIQTSTEVPQVQAGKRPLVPGLYVAIGITIVLVLSGLFIWAMIWLAQTQAPAIEALRDIFIIGLSLVSCVFGIALMVLLVMVIRLVNMIEFEIKPILEKTNETLGMVRGTSVFVSRNVVGPVTTASSYFFGLRRGLRTLFGDPRKNLSD